MNIPPTPDIDGVYPPKIQQRIDRILDNTTITKTMYELVYDAAGRTPRERGFRDFYCRECMITARGEGTFTTTTQPVECSCGAVTLRTHRSPEHYERVVCSVLDAMEDTAA